MPAPRKSRPMLLADGGTFPVYARTVSVDISDVPLEQPGVRLHINPSGAVMELPPSADGTPQLPVRVRADVVAAIVEQINAMRAEEAGIAPDEQLPPVVLPPLLKRLAKHTRHWPTPVWFRIGKQTGFPGKHPVTGTPQALYVNRETGSCQMWTGDATAPDPDLGDFAAITRREAREWLTANGYAAIPAVLLASPRKLGVADDAPPASG